jgi:hypothetical protein
LGQLNTNYIIFRNFQKTKWKYFFLKDNEKSDEIFENISFFEIEHSKLINCWTNMHWNGQGIMILN